MEKYIITSICHKDGTERTDGRYPMRVGSIGLLTEIHPGYPFGFYYIKDNKGEDKTGMLLSSIVEVSKQRGSELSEHHELEITTLNSVYTLQKIY